MTYFLYTLFFLSCVTLIGSVLLQPGKTDAGALFTSNVSSNAFGPRGTATVLSKFTIAAATCFMLSALLLAMPALNGNSSVLTTTGDTTTETTQPANTDANTANANVDANTANTNVAVDANSANIVVPTNANTNTNTAANTNKAANVNKASNTNKVTNANK